MNGFIVYSRFLIVLKLSHKTTLWGDAANRLGVGLIRYFATLVLATNSGY